MNKFRHAPLLFAAFGLGYWISLWTEGFAGDWAIKAMPMLIAAVSLFAAMPRRLGVPMAIGFVAAACGDVFLALDRQANLIQGLSCFLVTQLAYSTAFAARQRPVRGGTWLRLAVVGYAGVALTAMAAGLGAFLVPVVIYVIALATMAVLAAGVEHRPGRVYSGAVLFLIADSLIGLDRFVAPIPNAEIIIVGLYTTGQFLVFTGMLKTFGLRTD